MPLAALPGAFVGQARCRGRLVQHGPGGNRVEGWASGAANRIGYAAAVSGSAWHLCLGVSEGGSTSLRGRCWVAVLAQAQAQRDGRGAASKCHLTSLRTFSRSMAGGLGAADAPVEAFCTGEEPKQVTATLWRGEGGQSLDHCHSRRSPCPLAAARGPFWPLPS